MKKSLKINKKTLKQKSNQNLPPQMKDNGDCLEFWRQHTLTYKVFSNVKLFHITLLKVFWHCQISSNVNEVLVLNFFYEKISLSHTRTHTRTHKSTNAHKRTKIKKAAFYALKKHLRGKKSYSLICVFVLFMLLCFCLVESLRFCAFAWASFYLLCFCLVPSLCFCAWNLFVKK